MKIKRSRRRRGGEEERELWRREKKWSREESRGCEVRG